MDPFEKKVVIALIIIALGCAVGIWQGHKAADEAGQTADQNRALLFSFEKESKDRRDQSCDITEKAQKQAVAGVILTYNYLDNLPASEVGNSLNQLIITQMPKTYNDAKTTVAPEYCDDPGIGLKEPDPKLPPFKSFSYLLTK